MKTMVITGAAGVTGSLAAKTFAEGGHNLALLGRDKVKLDLMARDLNLPTERIHTQAIDLLDAAGVRDSAEAVHSKFGGVHALIHLVGGWAGGQTIPESSADDLQSMLNQHVWTTFNLFQSFVPHLAASGSGRVVVVSAPATVKPSAKVGLYAAAKSAQESLVMTLAEEYKSSGLTANIIQVKSIGESGTSPAEIVSAMTYLFSDAATKITGARIPLY